MLKNTSTTFGSIAKFFHWVMAILIISMLILGFCMTTIIPSSEKMFFYGLHKSTGILILGLGILRLSWRFLNPSPELSSTLKPAHRFLAKLSPIILYSLLFLMPLSGLILSQSAGHPIIVYNTFTFPMIITKDSSLAYMARLVHQYGALIFSGILILHISAALYHHIILKTNILTRMLPFWQSPSKH